VSQALDRHCQQVAARAVLMLQLCWVAALHHLLCCRRTAGACLPLVAWQAAATVTTDVCQTTWSVHWGLSGLHWLSSCQLLHLRVTQQEGGNSNRFLALAVRQLPRTAVAVEPSMSASTQAIRRAVGTAPETPTGHFNNTATCATEDERGHAHRASHKALHGFNHLALRAWRWLAGSLH
jgi:hypothetical protein